MITKYQANKIQDYIFGNVALSPPSSYYMGISSTPIDEDGNGSTEPTAPEYAKVAIVRNTTNWTASVDGVIKNKTRITLPDSLIDWGTYSYAFISDSAVKGEGNILYVCKLTKDRIIQSDSQLYFDPDGL